MKRAASLVAIALAVASMPIQASSVGYSIPNGWADTNRKKTKAPAKAKACKRRDKEKAAAKSRRQQRIKR